MIAPCGKPTKATRFGVEPAVVCAHAVAAGLIASRSGSAMLAPMPCNTIRRETCFLDIYMSYLRLFRHLRTARGHRPRLQLLTGQGRLRYPVHPELIASNDSLHQF